MSKPIYLSAKEAATELGVQPATLYAYVSRGLIRSVPGPGKQKRYDASDVRQLMSRKADETQRDGTRSLTGEAVLDTKLTMISDEAGPIYKGQLAIALARTSSLETVATLLWGCEHDPFQEPAPDRAPLLPEGLDPLNRLTMALGAWPLYDKAAYTLSENLLPKKGACLLRYAVSVLVGSEPDTAPVHSQLARVWGIKGAETAVLRAALILSADHELNTSTFSVRCAASTRAPLYASLLGGLGAFAGPRHGASSDRVISWLSDIKSEADVEEKLAARLARGEPLPGFGHKIYKGQDPRAGCLLDILKSSAPDNELVQLLPTILAAGKNLYGEEPNIDFALSASQLALGLPVHGAKILFCTGRIVGWIAHALEQYTAPDQIRPRAAYIGERPG